VWRIVRLPEISIPFAVPDGLGLVAPGPSPVAFADPFAKKD
jgi:hypothetical protein